MQKVIGRIKVRDFPQLVSLIHAAVSEGKEYRQFFLPYGEGPAIKQMKTTETGDVVIRHILSAGDFFEEVVPAEEFVIGAWAKFVQDGRIWTQTSAPKSLSLATEGGVL